MTRRRQPAIAARYAGEVVSGKIPACQWTHQGMPATDRRSREGKVEGLPYKFDKEKASRICRFIEMLPHIKGEWAKDGGRIRASAVAGIHPDRRLRLGVTRRPVCGGSESSISKFPAKTGNRLSRRSRDLLLPAPTERAARGLLARRRPETRRRSSGRTPGTWSKGRPGLKKAFRRLDHGALRSARSRPRAVSRRSRRRATASTASTSTAQSWTSSTPTGRGRSTTSWRRPPARRSQPLLWLITTAGSDRSGICYEQRTYLTKILDGVVKDDTYFGIIYTIDDGDDWTDPAVLGESEPELRRLASFRTTSSGCASRRSKMPSAQNNFLTKRLSVWVNADQALFNMDAWAKCADPSLTHGGLPGRALLDRDRPRAPARLLQQGEAVPARRSTTTASPAHYLSEGRSRNPTNAQYRAGPRRAGSRPLQATSPTTAAIEDDLREDCRLSQVCEVPYDPLHRPPVRDPHAGGGLPDGRTEARR